MGSIDYSPATPPLMLREVHNKAPFLIKDTAKITLHWGTEVSGTADSITLNYKVVRP